MTRKNEIQNLWKKLLEKNPSYREINRVIGVESLKDSVAKRLINKNLSSKKLSFLMRRHEELIEPAGRVIIKRNPSRENLFFIMRNVPELRKEAFFRFLELIPTNKELLEIMISVKENFCSDDSSFSKKDFLMECFKKIIERKPSKEMMFKILVEFEQLRKNSWRILLNRHAEISYDKTPAHSQYIKTGIHLGDFSLALVANKYPSLRGEALLELSERFVDNEILVDMICGDQEVRLKMWNKLKGQYVREKDLFYIMKFVPGLEKEALEILKKREANNDYLASFITNLDLSRINLIESCWDKLKKQNPTNDQLYRLVSWAKPLKENIRRKERELKLEKLLEKTRKIIDARVKLINKINKKD